MTNFTHADDATLVAAMQSTATVISKGKKGLGGSIIAGAIIGGIVVAVLIVAIFFGLRHRYRRSKGKTASTMEAGPENEKESEKCAEASEGSHGHYPTSIPECPSNNAQGDQSGITVCRAGPIAGPSSPQKSFDSSQSFPIHANYSNITTHAPRPQSYQTGQSFVCGLDPGAPPCMTCALLIPTAPAAPASSSSTTGDLSTSTYSPKEEYQIYDRKSCVSSTSPPLPPGAMPPTSPTIESYGERYKTSSPSLTQSPLPRSPPPRSAASPGGSTLRRWIMSPLSRSESIRTALPPYEQSASGSQQQALEKKGEKDEKKDESAWAYYTFM